MTPFRAMQKIEKSTGLARRTIFLIANKRIKGEKAVWIAYGVIRAVGYQIPTPNYISKGVYPN